MLKAKRLFKKKEVFNYFSWTVNYNVDREMPIKFGSLQIIAINLKIILGGMVRGKSWTRVTLR